MNSARRKDIVKAYDADPNLRQYMLNQAVEKYCREICKGSCFVCALSDTQICKVHYSKWDDFDMDSVEEFLNRKGYFLYG